MRRIPSAPTSPAPIEVPVLAYGADRQRIEDLPPIFLTAWPQTAHDAASIAIEWATAQPRPADRDRLARAAWHALTAPKTPGHVAALRDAMSAARATSTGHVSTTPTLDRLLDLSPPPRLTKLREARPGKEIDSLGAEREPDPIRLPRSDAGIRVRVVDQCRFSSDSPGRRVPPRRSRRGGSGR